MINWVVGSIRRGEDLVKELDNWGCRKEAGRESRMKEEAWTLLKPTKLRESF